MAKIPIEELFERWRIFPYSGGKRWQKSLFSVGEDSEKVLAKMRLLWSFFQKNGATESILHNLTL